MGIKTLTEEGSPYYNYFGRTGRIQNDDAGAGVTYPAWYGARGLSLGGGSGSGGSNIIDYYTIQSPGNGTDFGDLTYAGQGGAAVSNGERAVNSSHRNTGSPSYQSPPSGAMDYVTIPTTGNASAFGDMYNSGARAFLGAAAGGPSGNVTRGTFFGGYDGSSWTKGIEYITIATTGNGQDFGDLLNNGRSAVDGMTNGERAVSAGGHDGEATSELDYWDVETTSNASNFGDMLGSYWGRGTASNATRGIMAGGYYTQTIEYITIASTGNGTNFGNLIENHNGVGGFNDATRAVFIGGEGSSENSNRLSYVEFDTTGNSSSFGDTTNPSNNNYTWGASGAAS